MKEGNGKRERRKEGKERALFF